MQALKITTLSSMMWWQVPRMLPGLPPQQGSQALRWRLIRAPAGEARYRILTAWIQVDLLRRSAATASTIAAAAAAGRQGRCPWPQIPDSESN